MPDQQPCRVPAAEFGGDRFWRWLNRVADRDHEGHARWLVGDTDPTDRYRLRCDRCDVTVVEMVVDRTDAVLG